MDQLATGLKGKTMANGVHVVGTDEAIAEELADVWKKMRGPEGDVYRENVVETREIMSSSWESGGSRQAMKDLARYFRKVEI